MDARTGRIIWTMNVLQKFGGEKYPMGNQRVATRDWRKGAGESRRPRRFRHRAQQERWRLDLEEPERQGWLLFGDAGEDQQ